MMKIKWDKENERGWEGERERESEIENEKMTDKSDTVFRFNDLSLSFSFSRSLAHNDFDWIIIGYAR